MAELVSFAMGSWIGEFEFDTVMDPAAALVAILSNGCGNG